MSLNIGNTKIGSLYLGNTKIASAYLGNVQIFASLPYAEIVFRFSSDSYTPTASLLGQCKTSGNAKWVHVSGADWKIVTDLYTGAGGTQDVSLGIGRLCTTQNDVATFTLAKTGGVTAEIISVTGPQIQTMDRAFVGCNAITSFYSAVTSLNSLPALFNVNQAFDSCTGVTDDSARILYNAWSRNANITNHSATFRSCGPAQYLDEIPTGWGGTYMPVVANYMDGVKDSTNLSWEFYYQPSPALNMQWSDVVGAHIFTTDSVSSYAGVNMRKSNIKGMMNGMSQSGAKYYYPAFVENKPVTQNDRWYPGNMAITENYNGYLDASTSTGDMPGTLDEVSLGALRYFGQNDPSMMNWFVTYFCFLVTNTPVTSSWSQYSQPYGVLLNNNFRNTRFMWYNT